MTQDLDDLDLFPYYNNIDHQYDQWFNNSAISIEMEYNRRNRIFNSSDSSRASNGGATNSNNIIRNRQLLANNLNSSSLEVQSSNSNSTTGTYPNGTLASSTFSQASLSDFDDDDDTAYTSRRPLLPLSSSSSLPSSSLLQLIPLSFPNNRSRSLGTLNTNNTAHSNIQHDVVHLSQQFSDLNIDSISTDNNFVSSHNHLGIDFLAAIPPRDLETFNYNNNINFNNTIDTDITVVLNDTIYSETNNNTDDLTAHTHDNSNQVHTNEVSSLPSEPWFNEESVIYSHPELNNTIVDLSSEPSNEINQSNLDQRFNTGFGIFNRSRYSYSRDDELDGNSDVSDWDSMDLENGIGHNPHELSDASLRNQREFLPNQEDIQLRTPRTVDANPFPLDNTNHSLFSETTALSSSLDTTTPFPSSDTIEPTSSFDTTAPSSSSVIIHLPNDQELYSVPEVQDHERLGSISDLEINGEHVRILQGKN